MIVYKVGWDVDLGRILKYELFLVFIVIVDISGLLKFGNKVVILDDVLRDVEVGVRVDNDDDLLVLIIDG